MTVNQDNEGQDVKIDGLNPLLSFPVIQTQPVAPTGTVGITKFIVANILKNSTQTNDYVIPTGKKVTIQTISCVLPFTSNGSSDIYGRLLFIDTNGTTVLEVIEVTRGTFTEPIERSFSGDAKIIRIEINNLSASDLWSSTRWIGFEGDV